MKLAFFINLINKGGTEHRCTRLSLLLKQTNFDVHVITYYPEGYYRDLLINNNIKVETLFKRMPKSKLGKLSYYLIAIFKLRRIIKQTKADILYSWLELDNLIAFFASLKIKDLKLIWSIVTSGSGCYRPSWKIITIEKLCSLMSHFVPLIIANSYSGLEYYTVNRKFKPIRSAVIHNGVNTNYFVIDKSKGNFLRARWKTEPNQRIIGLVGRLAPVKGHFLFLQAAAEIIKLRQDVKFVCVGTGKTEYINKLIALTKQLNLMDHVIWAGHHFDMVAVYNALDIFCLPSLSEGTSNALCEAMACGLICVVSDVGDSKIVAGENNFIFEAGNVASLSVNLTEALNANWQTVSQVNGYKMERFFSEEIYVEAVKKQLGLFQ